jgi:hypothetical protein
MTRLLKVFAILSGCTVLVVVSYYAGGTMGFMEGYMTSITARAPMNAMRMVALLRDLRGGRTDRAISQLESDLDILVLEYQPPGKRILRFDWLAVSDYSALSMSRVVAYRREHPSEGSPDVRAAVDTILATMPTPSDRCVSPTPTPA